MIKLNQVRKDYPSFSLECSLNIQSGTIVGLIGQNGAGKSTTFKAILGLTPIDYGTIEIMNKPINSLDSEDKAKIGVAFSDAGFSEYLTINDIIAILNNMYEKFEKDIFVQYCTQFKLPLKTPIKTFSTGMKAKLKILVAITHHAKLLILDEPTAGLDVIAREEILDILRAYMEEDPTRTILISSHISSDLEGLCDEIYMIEQGKIILHEECDKLLDEYGIIKVSNDQYNQIDKSYLLKVKKENYGYSLLTNQKSFYVENYPSLIIEKSNIDEIILMMIRGKEL